jgi:hypothetical protein
MHTELQVSELVTYTVKATLARDQAAVRLRLSGHGTRVLIEVWDADRLPRPPSIGLGRVTWCELEAGGR